MNLDDFRLSDASLLAAANLFVHVTLVSSVAGLIAWFLRRRSSIRYGVLIGGLILILVAPLIPVVSHFTDVGIRFATVQQASSSAPASKVRQTKKVDDPALAGESPLKASAVSSPDKSHARERADLLSTVKLSPPFETALPTANQGRAGLDMPEWFSQIRRMAELAVGIWMLGALIGVLRLLVGWRRVVLMIRNSKSVHDVAIEAAFQQARRSLGMGDEASRLAMSDGLSMPIAAGMLRPVILIPSQLVGKLDSQQWFEIFTHELAHRIRRDQVVVWLQNIASALYWFHPLVAKLNRDIGQAREEVCDNFVVARSQVTDYSRTLLKVAESIVRSRPLPGTVGLFAGRWKLEQRIAGLLDGKRSRATRLGLLGRFVVAFTAIGLVFVAAATTLRIATAQDNPSAAKSDENPKPSADVETQPFVLNVCGPDKAPVAFAEVRVDSGKAQDWLVIGSIEKATKSNSIVKADEQGRIILALPIDIPIAFTVQMPGYGPYRAAWRNEKKPTALTIELEKAVSVGGVVVDENGKPIDGAFVRPRIALKQRPGDNSEVINGTLIKTNAAGQWTYESLPSSLDSFGVEISHPAFRPFSTDLSTRAFTLTLGAFPSVKTELPSGLTVSGTVTDSDGKPIEDALIRTKFLNDMRETRTDARGFYRLQGCDERTVRIVASAFGKAPELTEVKIEPGLKPVDFSLQPGGHVRIRVVDMNGRPASKTRVFFQRWREGRYRYFELAPPTEYTDENGIWEWNEAPLDEFEADISPRGAMTSRQKFIARSDEYLVKVPPLLKIVGKVIDANTKEPIPQFEVLPGVRSNPEYMNWVNDELFSGKNGRFDYIGDTELFGYHFKVQAPGHAALESRLVKSDEGNLELIFELQPAEDVAGKVLLPDGTPAIGAKVVLGLPGDQIEIRNGAISNGIHAQQTLTDSQGEFRFPYQSNPPHLIVMHDDGYAFVRPLTWTQLKPTDRPSFEFASSKTVTLIPWSRAEGIYRVGEKIVGSAKLALDVQGYSTYGEDVPNVFIHFETVSDNEGRFVFERVFAGGGNVYRRMLRLVGEGAVEQGSSRWQFAAFKPNETTQIAIGGDGAKIRGTLTIPDDFKQEVVWAFAQIHLETQQAVQPSPPNAKPPIDPTKIKEWLEAFSQSPEYLEFMNRQSEYFEQRSKQPHFSATVDKDGRFLIDDVPAGNYTLHVRFSERWSGVRLDHELTVGDQDAADRKEIELQLKHLLFQHRDAPGNSEMRR